MQLRNMRRNLYIQIKYCELTKDFIIKTTCVSNWYAEIFSDLKLVPGIKTTGDCGTKAESNLTCCCCVTLLLPRRLLFSCNVPCI